MPRRWAIPRENVPAFLPATSLRPDEVEHLVDPLARYVARLGQRQEVVPGLTAGVVGLGVEQGAHLPHRGTQLLVGDAVDGGRAFLGTGQAQDQPQRGRLAGPVGTQEPRHHPGLHFETEVVDGDFLPEVLRQVVDFDQTVRPFVALASQRYQ